MMLLLDRNNEPSSTVYYLAALAYSRIEQQDDGIDASSLYQRITADFVGKKISYDFFLMALDFLYLLDRIIVDDKGGLHVYQNIAHSQYQSKCDHARSLFP